MNPQRNTTKLIPSFNTKIHFGVLRFTSKGLTTIFKTSHLFFLFSVYARINNFLFPFIILRRKTQAHTISFSLMIYLNLIVSNQLFILVDDFSVCTYSETTVQYLPQHHNKYLNDSILENKNNDVRCKKLSAFPMKIYTFDDNNVVLLLLLLYIEPRSLL